MTMTDYDPLSDNETKQLYEGSWSDFDALKNGSVTDTRQWCQLHRGHCPDVVPVRRHFEDPNRRDEIFLACQKCIRDLKKAGLIDESKYAGLPCAEVVVSKGREVDLSVRGPKSPKTARSLLRSRQRTYEVTLDALQVKYLRALGLKVIAA